MMDMLYCVDVSGEAGWLNWTMALFLSRAPIWLPVAVGPFKFPHNFTPEVARGAPRMRRIDSFNRWTFYGWTCATSIKAARRYFCIRRDVLGIRAIHATAIE